MNSATAAIETIEQRTEILVHEFNAKGALERSFCRDLASSQVTAESYERTILHFQEAETPNGRDVHRFQLAKSHALRDGRNALKELKGLQDRRNELERFPDQTNHCPPLANHALYIGALPKIKPIAPILRTTMAKPTDNTQRHPVKHPKDKELDDLLNGAFPLDKLPKKPNKDLNPTLKHP
ncbi:MAG: hypothetical protein J0L64_18620 [Acidobacteria bacterium]|nr:hypothetical protein [Acidobacteriota bacterium]